METTTLNASGSATGGGTAPPNNVHTRMRARNVVAKGAHSIIEDDWASNLTNICHPRRFNSLTGSDEDTGFQDLSPSELPKYSWTACLA